LPETAERGRPAMASGMNFPKQDTLRLISILGEWEETRHKDPVRASGMLKDAEIVGTSDLPDGLAKVIRHNEWMISKRKGGSNEK
jgi:hypothetical protein